QFNTRSESICEKASFRRLAPKSLCLVAVEGMPVILGDEESTDTWLDCSSSSKFDSLLKPYEDPDLVWYPVTRAMYKVPFDGPECIYETVDTVEDRGENSIITKKRDYEEFSADAKPAAYKTNEKSAIPVKKKANPKGSLDKQPTLFSYFGTISMNIFFIIRMEPDTAPHCNTGRDPRLNPRRLFPSHTVMPLRLFSRLRGRHQPTNTVEFDRIDMVTPPLLSIPIVVVMQLYA
ncbi:hypothetical protein C1H46_037426, partial [Malus baccata]